MRRPSVDDNARIEAYKRGLRIKYPATAQGIADLRAAIDELMEDDAAESVLITQQVFEGGQASGTITLEPLAKLQAMIDVLGEIDPDNMPDEPAPTRFADFRFGTLET